MANLICDRDLLVTFMEEYKAMMLNLFIKGVSTSTVMWLFLKANAKYCITPNKPEVHTVYECRFQNSVDQVDSLQIHLVKYINLENFNKQNI